MAGTTRVVLAVATYRRAELLRDLLPLLVAEVDELEDEARVVVVDNDPDGSARAVVERLGSPSVDYYLEPRPGIAAARNRALEESAGAEALVFIDDDERPGEAWLQTLVAAWKEWRCAAVAGPVVSLFEGSVDPWVETCSTFRRPRRASGTIMAGAATSNLLLDVGQLSRLGLRFDDRFGGVSGQPAPRVDEDSLDGVGIDGADVDPVLQCSHGRVSFVRAHSAQLISESAIFPPGLDGR